MPRHIGKYKARTRTTLKREPRYLLRKRGLVVRMNITLQRSIALALRNQVFERGGTLSHYVEIAIARWLGLKIGKRPDGRSISRRKKGKRS